jgi:hypothetical protein
MARFALTLTRPDVHWRLLSTLSATKRVNMSKPARVPSAPPHQHRALTTFWIHFRGCDQSSNEANWTADWNVPNVPQTWASMRGKVCSVAAVTGSCQVSALPKAGSTKPSRDRTTTMAFECHPPQQAAGNQAQAKATCKIEASSAPPQKDALLRDILRTDTGTRFRLHSTVPPIDGHTVALSSA